MNYGDAEQFICDRIAQTIVTLNLTQHYMCVLMPETTNDFRELANKNVNKAIVFVQYFDSVYDPSVSLSSVVQTENAKFRITIDSRKLRGAGGIYNALDFVKRSLLGWRFADSGRIKIVKYGLMEFEENSWQVYLEIECELFNIQNLDDLIDDTFPGSGPFTKVNTIIQGKSQNNSLSFSPEFDENQFI